MTPTSNLVIRAPSVEFTVDRSTGEAYISQTKLAELCGVTQQAISVAIHRFSSFFVGANLNENNQLCAKSACNVVAHYAAQGKAEAIKTFAKIGEAGMKAYIYHMAGYVMEAKPAVPQTYLDAPWGRSSLNPAKAGGVNEPKRKICLPPAPHACNLNII